MDVFCFGSKTVSLCVAHDISSPHLLLPLGVHACGRLVQQQHRRASQHAQREAQLEREEQRLAPTGGLRRVTPSPAPTFLLIPSDKALTGCFCWSCSLSASTNLQGTVRQPTSPLRNGACCGIMGKPEDYTAEF